MLGDAIISPHALVVLCFGLWTVFCSSVQALPGQVPAPYRYRNPIVFQRAHLDDTGKPILRSKLWVMEADGTSLRQLTDGDTFDDHPSFYSDRSRVLFAEFPGNALNLRRHSRLISLNIYTRATEVIEDADGCSVHHATLSPIDNLLAYHKDCGPDSSHWIGAGTNARRIPARVTDGVRTREGFVVTYNFGPAPPGGIAIVEFANARARAQARLIYKKGAGEGPVAISSDSRWLAWDEILASGDYEVFLGKADGTNVQNLSRHVGNDGHPWFSRDGRSVVFHSNRSGHFEIWRVDLKTQRAAQLTFGGGRFESTRPRM